MTNIGCDAGPRGAMHGQAIRAKTNIGCGAGPRGAMHGQGVVQVQEEQCMVRQLGQSVGTIGDASSHVLAACMSSGFGLSPHQ